jgi:N-dimethylarginine dimethylaminohydrolase
MAAHFLVSPPSQSAFSTLDALRQWDRFTETLGCAGDVALHEMQSGDDAPRRVFVANGALIVGKLAILSSFRGPEQKPEQAICRQALARAGLATTCLPQTYFEGAADTLFDRVRPFCYAGYGWHTERSATLQLQEVVGCRVLPLMLIDQQFSHLNTALCPLASGHALVHMPAFSPHAQTLLRRSISSEHLIDIDIDDALGLACNAVEIGDALVFHRVSRKSYARV